MSTAFLTPPVPWLVQRLPLIWGLLLSAGAVVMSLWQGWACSPWWGAGAATFLFLLEWQPRPELRYWLRPLMISLTLYGLWAPAVSPGYFYPLLIVSLLVLVVDQDWRRFLLFGIGFLVGIGLQIAQPEAGTLLDRWFVDMLLLAMAALVALSWQQRKRRQQVAREQVLAQADELTRSQAAIKTLTDQNLSLQKELADLRQKSEEQEAFYRLVINQVPVDIVVFDNQHRYLLLTPKSIKDPALREWMLGKDDYDYCEYREKPRAIADRRRRLFEQVKATQKEVAWEDEYLVDGKRQSIMRMLKPVYSDQGKLQYFLGIGLDISERKLAEEKMEQARLLAESASRAKEEFLSTMSHEIRTPLNAVISSVEWLLGEEPRPDQQETLEILRFSSDLLLNLVNDILDFSKISTGKFELEEVPVDLESIVRSLAASHQERASQNGSHIDVVVTPAFTHTQLGDPTRLTQIFNNLVSNAVKFTENGSIRIILRPESLPGEMLQVDCEVTDTGIGIDAARLEAIFDPFTQASASTTRQFGGTGLGLAITKKLLGAMGVKIQVQSAPGVGTTFSFRLTMKQGKALLSNSFTHQTEALEADLEGMQVLVVEDHPVNAKVLGKFLHKWGVRYTHCTRGRQAVNLLRGDYHPNLILMDLRMPGLDGFETTKLIRELDNQNAQVAILALSANAFTEVEQQVLEAGIDGFVPKPFRANLLHQALSKYYDPRYSVS